MKNKYLKLSTALLLGFGISQLQAQTMYVKPISGTQTSYGLSNVRKMTFVNGNATVQTNDNNTDTYALSGLRYMKFADILTSNTEQLSNNNSSYIAYPNPVTDILHIDLLGETSEGTLTILTQEGKLLIEQKTVGVTTTFINLSNLPQGMYLCRYTNQNVKTIKIIKL